MDSYGCFLDDQLLANIKNKDDEDIDPLQESIASRSNFQWLFNDIDILHDSKNSLGIVIDPEVNVVNNGKGRCKRRNVSNTSNSYCSQKKNAAAVQSELPLPTFQACGKGPAQSVANAVESWMLIFNDDMLRLLLHHINNQMHKNPTKLGVQRPADLIELRSFLGLSYLCGVFRNAQHNGPLNELWTMELGNVVFRATMSFGRFEYISECLNLEENWNEGLCLWRKLLINCRSYYSPSGWLCIDQQPSIVDNTQLVLCCDAKTMYMTNGLLFKKTNNLNINLDHLICDFKTTGRNVTISECFTNIEHCHQLFQQRLSTLGLVDITASDWPEYTKRNFSSGATRLVKFNDKTLLACGLASEINVAEAHVNTAHVCSQFRELSNRYCTTCATPNANKKPDTFLRLLHQILNTAAINAWVLLCLSSNGDATMEFRDFQRQLGLFLTQQRLQQRLMRRSTTTSLVTKIQICEILGQSAKRLFAEAIPSAKQIQSVAVFDIDSAALPKNVRLSSRYGEKHRRCKPCSQAKRGTKARSRCQQCLAHRCGNHLISRCYECMGIVADNLPAENADDVK